MTQQPDPRPRLLAERFVEGMTANEYERALRVSRVLPAIAERASEADQTWTFPTANLSTLRAEGILGLMVPKNCGGLGGGLRDLAAATFALSTACPSTALAFFFHSSAVSRGTLALEAADAGLFDNPEDEAAVRAFGKKVLGRMGAGQYMANFGSETVKSSKGAVTIGTEAKRVEGGWRLNGVKSFGCNTGVADWYLVTAKLEGAETAEGIVTFLVRSDTKGVRERHQWKAIGMRATATHGIILENAFVPDEESLVVPGAFLKMMDMSRGSMVGNQLAGIACYLGAAQAAYDYALSFLMKTTFRDTGAPLATSALHQQLIGQMAMDLETAYLWLRRQLALETSEPPLLPKSEVVMQWRLCKGEATEACWRVAQGALKACGTSNTGDAGPIARAIRNLSMGIVQAFPAERGRLEVAKTLVAGQEQVTFTAG